MLAHVDVIARHIDDIGESQTGSLQVRLKEAEYIAELALGIGIDEATRMKAGLAGKEQELAGVDDRREMPNIGVMREFRRRNDAFQRELFARQPAENAAHQGIADLARNR